MQRERSYDEQCKDRNRQHDEARVVAAIGWVRIMVSHDCRLDPTRPPAR